MLSLENNLIGKVLIASPSLSSGSYFSKTVVYILRNSIEGSIGLIVNHPLVDVEGNVFVKHKKQNIPLKITQAHSGGPVEIEKGFILHLDQKHKLGANADPIIKLNSDLSVLRSLAKRKTPDKNSLFIFGYCSWDSGQLEEEIMDNTWLIAPPDKKIIFEIENQHKWEQYLGLLNINLMKYVDCPGSC